MPELTEAELQRLQKLDHTVGVLMKNPAAKRKIFEAYKVVEPNANIPELDMEEAAKAPVMELEKTVKELKTQIENDASERAKDAKLARLNGDMERGFAKLRSEGWLDDGIDNVKKLMEEKGYIDPEDAAAIYLSKHPPQAPATPSGTGAWNFMDSPTEDDAYVKAITASKGAADNENLVMQEAHKALNSFRGAQRR